MDGSEAIDTTVRSTDGAGVFDSIEPSDSVSYRSGTDNVDASEPSVSIPHAYSNDWTLPTYEPPKRRAVAADGSSSTHRIPMAYGRRRRTSNRARRPTLSSLPVAVRKARQLCGRDPPTMAGCRRRRDVGESGKLPTRRRIAEPTSASPPTASSFPTVSGNTHFEAKLFSER